MFLFNNALNTFYLWLYGVGHMVKDHSDIAREKPAATTLATLSNSSKDYFICIIPDRITHTRAFVISVIKYWLEREIAQ